MGRESDGSARRPIAIPRMAGAREDARSAYRVADAERGVRVARGAEGAARALCVFVVGSREALESRGKVAAHLVVLWHGRLADRSRGEFVLCRGLCLCRVYLGYVKP